MSTSPAVLNLLGSPLMKVNPEETETSITPNYLVQSNVGYKVDVQEQAIRLPSVPLQLNQRSNKRINTLFFVLAYDICCTGELVFKLRIAYSTDADFIEVEIDRAELTYSQFMAVCCSELGLNSKYVERLRKLPNTRLRKDRDVQRIKDFEVKFCYEGLFS